MASLTAGTHSRGNRLFQSIRAPKVIRRLAAIMMHLKGPMSPEEKFITLDEAYLSKFDEIVVIGDIHGCYDEFKELLDKVHAETPSRNPDKCLKIIVGDLVNKGPRSADVLKLCRDEYPDSILSVRGNHDEKVLSLYNSFRTGGLRLEERDKWVEALCDEDVSYLRLLPYTISIPSLKIIVVHAGLNPSLEDPAKTTPTNLMTTMRGIVLRIDERMNETYYECVKTNLVGDPWAWFWRGPEHIYFGHNARLRLQKHDFATGLDTGCVYGDRLSYIYVKGPKRGQLLNVKAKKVYEATSDTEDRNNWRATA